MIRHTTVWLCARTFAGDRRGNISMIFALSAMPIFFAVGMAIDLGRSYAARQALQSAADIAALAGVITAGDVAQKEAATLASFNANFDASQHETANPVITTTDSAVTLKVSLNVPTTFMAIANIDSLKVNAHAAAGTGSDSALNGPICLLALSPNGYKAIHVQGTNDMALNNCWAYANSSNATAIHGVGTADATAKGFCAVGGYDDHNNFTPKPRTACPVVGDPYAGTPVPALDDCPVESSNGNGNGNGNGKGKGKDNSDAETEEQSTTGLQLASGTHTLSPGQYCGGISMSPHAEVTFEPGVYIIRNGPLHVQALSTAIGENVVFYFYGSDATLIIKGGASVDLKGRSTGESYEGFLFVQHPDAAPGAITEIWGGGSLKMDGVLYMPTQQVEIRGNGNINATAKLFAMVANSFYMRGNGVLTLNADPAGAGLPDVLTSTNLPGKPRIQN